MTFNLTARTENAIPIEGWYDDPRDKELLALLPLLYALRDVDDVRPHLHRYSPYNRDEHGFVGGGVGWRVCMADVVRMVRWVQMGVADTTGGGHWVD